MNVEDVKVAILQMEGTNCEQEMFDAFANLGARPEFVHLNGPGEEENDLDIEDHEEHGDQVELHGESFHRFLQGHNSALVRSELLGRRVVRSELPRGEQRHHGEHEPEEEHQGDRKVRDKIHVQGESLRFSRGLPNRDRDLCW